MGERLAYLDRVVASSHDHRPACLGKGVAASRWTSLDLQENRRGLSMIARGWIIVFEGEGRVRFPSLIIYRSLAEAREAWNTVEPSDRPLKIVPVTWDDSRAKNPW
jgi:hypothetical protein